MLGEKIGIFTVEEVREHFPNGITLIGVQDGQALFRAKDDKSTFPLLADFSSFLGSITSHRFGDYTDRYGRVYDKFTRHKVKFMERKIEKLVQRFVYLNKE